MSDRANQFVLGYFVSVFVFCLIVLRTIRGGDELKFVPSIAVLVGLLLAIGGVLVLVFFIHHIADSLQITRILEKITDETKQAIETMFPQDLGDAATESEIDETIHAAEVKDWKKIRALQAGYVQDIDTVGLMEFAEKNKILVKMRLGIGQFLGRGAVLAEITPDTSPEKWEMPISDEKIKEINDFFSIARHRTIEQYAGFGIRQIVDIALKALSPGINDTTTAISCIDNLGEIIGEIARRQMPARVRAKANVPRVIALAPDFQNYVETAFDQVRISGRSNQAIFERLLTTMVFIAGCTNIETRRTSLRIQVKLIGEFAEPTLETEYEKEKVQLKLNEAKKILGNEMQFTSFN